MSVEQITVTFDDNTVPHKTPIEFTEVAYDDVAKQAVQNLAKRYEAGNVPNLIDFAVETKSEDNLITNGRIRKQQYDDMKGFIDNTKKFLNDFCIDLDPSDEHVKTMKTILSEAIAREEQLNTKFIPVNGMKPAAAADRVYAYTKQHPDQDVVPVDVTSALDDSTTYQNIRKFTHINYVTQMLMIDEVTNTSDLPDILTVMVPTSKSKETMPFAPGAPTSEIITDNETIQYVRFDALPVELSQLVRSTLEWAKSPDDIHQADFKTRIATLVDAVKYL